MVGCGGCRQSEEERGGGDGGDEEDVSGEGERGEIARKIGGKDGGLAEVDRGLKKIEFLECNHS